MTTLINGIEVKIEWEKERTLSDVRAGLEVWLAQQDYELVSLLTNGKAVQPDNLSLEFIETLEVETVPIQDKPLQTLLLIKNFFNLVRQALTSTDQDTIGDLEKEFTFLQPCLFPFLNPFQNLIATDLAFFSLPWKNLTELKEPAERLYQAFAQICDEWANPQASFTDSLKNLQLLLPQLQEIAVLFQAGQDNKALDLLVTLLELLQNLRRQATKLNPPLTNEQDLQHILSFLSQLKAALENQDFVLLADLVEYEICPRIAIFLDQTILPS